MFERRLGRQSLQGLAVEPAFQHRLHAPVGAAPVEMARAAATLQNGREQLHRGWPHRLRPVEQARRWPGQVLLMALRTMVPTTGQK